MTKFELINKVREKAVNRKEEYLREGLAFSARVENMTVFIDHIVAIEIPTFMKARLTLSGCHIGIDLGAVVIWVKDDSVISVV